MEIQDPVEFFHYSRAFAGMFVVTLLVFDVAALLAAGIMGPWDASVENGVIENTQMVVLFVAALAFILGAVRAHGMARFLLAGGAALALFMANRELASDFVPDDHWLHFLKSFTMRLLVWGAVAGIFLAWMIVLRAEIWRVIRHVDGHSLVPPLLFAGFLVASYLSEEIFKTGIGGDNRVWLMFFEETLELNGYLVLCCAAVYFARRARPAIGSRASPDLSTTASKHQGGPTPD